MQYYKIAAMPYIEVLSDKHRHTSINTQYPKSIFKQTVYVVI